MGHRHRSSRRSQPRYDDGYGAYDPYQSYQQPQAYDAYDPYEQYAPRDPFTRDPYSRDPYSYSRDAYPNDAYAQEPAEPRRHKSKSGRHRRAPSPVIYHSDSPQTSSKKHGSRRSKYDDERRGRSLGAEQWEREPSPDQYAPEPYIEEAKPSRRKSRSSRHDRGARRSEPSFPQQDPRFVDPYEQDYYGHEASSRQYPGDPRDPYRDQYQDAYQSRDQGRDRDRDRSYRSRGSARDSPPRAKSQGRSARHYGDDDGDYDDEYMAAGAGAGAGAAAYGQHRHQKSQNRGRQERGQSPSRGRPPPSNRSRGGEPSKRRNSMPATTKPRNPWWQNPLLQAGARTALTAGAQAAMKSRGDQGDWLGAKGAKVATAALGAALVDGFIGQKHPGGTRHNVAKQGVDLAAAEAAAGAQRHASHKH